MMNKKRFKLEFIGNVPCVIDYEENLVYGVIEYVDLLNELSDKNRQLKEENEKLKETCNKFEEAIEKRGYEDIDDFW